MTTGVFIGGFGTLVVVAVLITVLTSNRRSAFLTPTHEERAPKKAD